MLSGIVENLHKHKLNMTENLIEYNLPQAHNCKLLFTGRAIYWSQESQYNYKMQNRNHELLTENTIIQCLGP